MRSIAEIFRSYAVLDTNGRHVNGTDKMSNHNYGDAYERIIANHKLRSRETVKLMMEVGVADGASILAWREVFPNATCVGLDIHHSDNAHGDRIEFHRGDATKQEVCERVVADRQFDFIVDDATHHIGDILSTLYWLWPYVAPNGLYVVEEWEGAAGDRNRIRALFPDVYIVGTCGPYIQDEPLVVMRKPA